MKAIISLCSRLFSEKKFLYSDCQLKHLILYSGMDLRKLIYLVIDNKNVKK